MALFYFPSSLRALCLCALLPLCAEAATPTPAPAQTVSVVTSEHAESASASMIAIDVPSAAVAPSASTTPPAARHAAAQHPISPWSGPVPLAGVLWVLVASMPVLVVTYFLYQLSLYIRARRSGLHVTPHPHEE